MPGILEFIMFVFVLIAFSAIVCSMFSGGPDDENRYPMW